MDQILADEQITTPGSPGQVLWELTDHSGSVPTSSGARHGGGVVKHRAYDAFGKLAWNLNHDGNVDLADIDLSLWAINQGVEDELFDLNGDGVVDNLTGGDLDQLILYIVKTYYGDANLDGQFNSADIAVVLERASTKTEQQQLRLGRRRLNGDGDFDSSDFSFAFGEGGYDQPNRGGGTFATHQTIIGYTGRPLDLVTGLQNT